ncbi:MAG: PDZ domain-containing protein [Anaerolineae bacterium]|nr:PDZ domain-containing protein [Anaerolineae bacterium]
MRKKWLRMLLVFSGVALALLGLFWGPSLALRALGLSRQGTVETALAEAAAPATPTEGMVGQPLDSLSIRCSWCEGGKWTCSAEEMGVSEFTGRLDESGQPEYRLVFDEAGFGRLFELVAYRLEGTPYRNLRFDFRDGGAVVYAELDANADAILNLPSGVAYMGISFSSTEMGFEVTEILPFGPADQAGVEAGDVIYELDGASALDVSSLPDWIQAHSPGDVVVLGILRDGQEIMVKVKLEEWTKEAPWHEIGLVVVPDVTGSRLVLMGLSIGDNLYSPPRTGPLASAIVEAQREMDEALEDVVIVGPLEGEARLDQVIFAEDSLTVVIR